MSQRPVARMTLASDLSATTDDYASLFLSDTNRSPYTAAPMTQAQTDGLTRVAENSSASLAILSDRQDMATLGNFGVEGTSIETRNVSATKESDAVSTVRSKPRTMHARDSPLRDREPADS